MTTWHVPENRPAGASPTPIVVTTPGAASGARSTVVTGWPAGWTVFPKILTALRAGVLLGNLEATAQASGTLTISGVIDGYTDFALQAGDTFEIRPSKLMVTEIQAAVDAGGGGGGVAIGGAIGSGTAGRVLFEGAGPVLADSINLNYDGSTLLMKPVGGAHIANFTDTDGTTIRSYITNKGVFCRGLAVGTTGDPAYDTATFGLVLSMATDAGAYLRLSKGAIIGWNDTDNDPNGSVVSGGLARGAAAVVRITDGSTGSGTISSVAKSPTSLSSSQNNYAPGVGRFYRLTASTTVNITGLVAGADGQECHLWNIGSNAITLTNQDSSSTAANRWLTTTGASVVLAANRCAFAVYDLTSTAWRVSLLP